MDSNNTRYVGGSNGGPPQGGRAPGLRPVSAPHPFSTSPPPYQRLPPIRVVGPPRSIILQGPPVVIQPAIQYVPVGPPAWLVARPRYLSPPPPTAPVSQRPPPPEPARPTIPGETMKGKKVTFDNGATYLFPEKVVTIMFINNNFQPWKNPGVPFEHTTHYIDCSSTVRHLMSQLGIPITSPNQWGIIEAEELGGGSWRALEKVVPLDLDFEKNKYKALLPNVPEDKLTALVGADPGMETLESLGWNATRGTSRKPVWIAVWKE